MHYYLIGMPGSGKSYWGKILSQKLEMPFIDLDDLVESYMDMSIPDIFKQYGEEKFRLIEHSCLESIPVHNELIVSTGGGTACYYDNLELMKSRGKTIYLKARIETLCQRLSEDNINRPILKVTSIEDLYKKLQKILNARTKFYEQADFQFEEEKLNMNELAAIIHQ